MHWLTIAATGLGLFCLAVGWVLQLAMGPDSGGFALLILFVPFQVISWIAYESGVRLKLLNDRLTLLEEQLRQRTKQRDTVLLSRETSAMGS
jgi:hypothetical protein